MTRREEIDRIIKANIKMAGFISLVKRMREAQTIERKWGIVNFKTEEDKVACYEAIRRMYQLEAKVDEYLKKME